MKSIFNKQLLIDKLVNGFYHLKNKTYLTINKNNYNELASF